MMEHRPLARIRALAGPLADQIAAGEVIERPASVAKELLENSLDAGAAQVTIEVEGGGVRLLRVRDDGAGIDGRDLALAFERHATSKIASLDDLEAVRSMGFRGEALSSIASVSRLELVTLARGADHAARIAIEGGRVTATGPAAHPAGTTVTVRDLFFNTPARRKFLRTERTESRHIEDLVRRLALSAFAVGFRFLVDGRMVLELPPAETPPGRQRRLARVCGRAFMDAALALELEAGELRLDGWVGGPQVHRAQGDVQYFFVNERAVRDPLSRHALRLAYADLIPPNRHPAWVLRLSIDPRAVDVNVHPTKQEVRFREARLVHDFLHRAVRRALAGSLDLATDATPEMPARHPLAAFSGTPSPGAVSGWAALYGAPPAASVPPAVADAEGALPLGRAQALLHRVWLIAGTGTAPLLIDLAAATGWRLRRRLAAELEVGEVRSRPLLVPIAIEVAEAAADLLEAAAGEVERAGVEVRRVGPSSLSLRRVPTLLGEGGGAALAEVLVQELHPARGLDGAAVVGMLAAAAVRAITSSAPSPQALDGLLRELERLEFMAAVDARDLWCAPDPAAFATMLGATPR